MVCPGIARTSETSGEGVASEGQLEPDHEEREGKADGDGQARNPGGLVHRVIAVIVVMVSHEGLLLVERGQDGVNVAPSPDAVNSLRHAWSRPTGRM